MLFTDLLVCYNYGQMKLKLILNPVSRGLKQRGCWTRIQKALDERKIPYDIECTEGPGHGTILAKKAVEAGYDTIVSIGGDGMANEVANGMIGSDAVFGVIPCGDANDFPKMIGMPKVDPERACDIIREGFTRTIDVGVINGRYFLNVVGIGIDGEITEAKARIKHYLPGFIGYYYESLKALLTYAPKKVNIKIDGSSLDASVLSLSIGNGRCCGGGFLFTPEAEIDDGILDVCLVRYMSRLRTVWDLPKVPKAEHIKLPYVSIYKGKEITAESGTLLTAHIDGEIAKAHKFEIKVLPGKLRVLAKRPE